MAIIQMNLGTVQLCRGEWSAAEECFRAALQQFQAMEHGLGVAYCLYNLTETLRWAGRIPESTEVLRAAEQSLERVDAAQLRPHLMLAQAELFLAGGDPEGAAGRAAEARVLADELGYESGGNLARLTQGRALLAAGQLAEAERHLESAAEGFRHMDEPLEEARARASLAEVLARRGRTGKARSARSAALEIIERLEALPWLEHLPVDRG
jgi:tetratricopeptide (TPR) repeat protein